MALSVGFPLTLYFLLAIDTLAIKASFRGPMMFSWDESLDSDSSALSLTGLAFLLFCSSSKQDSVLLLLEDELPSRCPSDEMSLKKGRSASLAYLN